MSIADPGAPAPPVNSANSSRATTALVLGIVGIVCCQICSPIAWYLGSQEVKSVKAGLSPAASEGTARAGMILGIVGTILMVFALLWIIFFGGMAVISAITQGHH